jgi:alkanesulfonate monooxygenase SsuD/methylene tetrahydromethanopterin reductase-like flavin-dependent oxidoreductase (luciferase family)
MIGGAPTEVAPGPRFGVTLPTSGPFATPENIFRVAERAEALGFADVWVNDHYTFPRSRLTRSPSGSIEACHEQEPNFFESLTTLAVVGGRLRRIGVAVHAVVLPVRDVRLFTKQISTIQELVGHRLTIAPAIGGPDAFEVMQVPQSERGRRLDEALEAMTTILRSEHPVSFHGTYTDFTDATFYPRPQTIRLWITGDAEAALRRVVRYATGWFSSSASLERFPALLTRLGELAREEGRDVGGIERATDLFICLADTNEEARDISAATLAHRYGTAEVGRRHAAIGDAGAVAEHLIERVRLGITYLELRFICHDVSGLLEMLERVAREVLPTVRAAAASPSARISS